MNNRFNIALATVLMCALLTSCMETTLGLEKITNTVTVRAKLRTDSTSIRPLPGVSVVLLDSTQTFRLDSSFTNGAGSAQLLTENDPVRTTMFVRAGRVGNLAPNPVLTQVNLCDSAIVNVEYAQPRVCADLVNGRDSVIFSDPVTGSRDVLVNRPALIERCYTFTYSGTQNATVAPPSLRAPFALQGIFVNGAPVPKGANAIVQPGQTLTICFTVITKDAGTFTSDVILPIACPPASSSVTLNLFANVVAERCECSAQDIEITIPDPVVIGQTSQAESDVLYDNSSSNCDIRIERVRVSANTDQRWLLQPTSGETVFTIPAGQSRSISARFRPTAAGNFTDTVFYRAVTSTGEVCDFTVELNGCVLQCPTIRLQNGRTVQLGTASVGDVTTAITPALPCDVGGNEFFDPNESRFTWPLTNPSNCATITANAELTNFNFRPAQDVIRLQSGTVTLAPQGEGSIIVNRDNISIEMARDFARTFPGRPLEITAQLRITTSITGCETTVNVAFPLDTVPPLSPPNTLISYQQIVNPIKPDPDFTIFILDDINGVTAPNTYESYQLGEDRANITPQNFGDLYATVARRVVDQNTDPAYSGANPAGQLPLLNIRQGSRLVEGAFWRNMSITQFSNRTGTGGVVSQFALAVNSLTFDITPNAPRQMAASTTEAGNVYAFRVRSGSIESLGGTCNDVYALVFIRGVDNGFGTFAATNRQSQIQFQVIYPVYGR